MFDFYNKFATSTQFYLYGKRECTQTGWQRASKKYAQPDLLADKDLSLAGKVFLVTGANTGIGKEITKFFATKGADVYMVCRSKERGEAAQEELKAECKNDRLHLIVADVGLEQDVRAAWVTFESHQKTARGSEPVRLDGLVCNAGALLNEKQLTAENVEVTFASHLLFGSYLLSKLAIPTLEQTPGSRVVFVSSGGMYNTKFPAWSIACGRQGTYDGNLAYARAKRGQVLLAEQLSKLHPAVRFVSCHPGWVSTEGVDKAFGSTKRFLEPMRNTWEGAEGIIWLCVVGQDQLEAGAFYLDRTARRKHIAGPAFSEGSFTKNSEEEVRVMMQQLEKWSSKESRPAWVGEVVPDTLQPLQRPIELERFMGRWHVWAHIPTPFDKNTSNNIEDYTLKDGVVSVQFTSVKPGKNAVSVMKQKGKMANGFKTQWSLTTPVLGVWVPVPFPYLLVEVDEAYEHTLVTVPDRSYLWVMSKQKQVDPARLASLLDKAEQLGFDLSLIVHPPVRDDIPDPPIPS